MIVRNVIEMYKINKGNILNIRPLNMNIYYRVLQNISCYGCGEPSMYCTYGLNKRYLGM